MKKKLIHILSIAAVIIAVLGINMTVQAYDHPDYDMENGYFINNYPAYYYLKTKIWSWSGNGCSWSSTEVDMEGTPNGYAYAYMEGFWGNTASSESWHINNGWVKTDAAWMDGNVAGYVEHTASRWGGSDDIEYHDNYSNWN